MNFTKKSLRLYAVTDRSWLHGETLYEQVEKALKGKWACAQWPEIGGSTGGSDAGGSVFVIPSFSEHKEEAKELLELCHKYNVNLIINDNVALAAKVGADGVHIGQSDMGVEKARAILGKEKIIGVTAKTVEQAKAAEAAGADYLGSGAVFGTSTKKDAKPMDHALLQEICESVKIPVVAIGGIDGGNILLLKGRKMAGVAVVSGLFACEDIKKAAEDLREKADRICE